MNFYLDINAFGEKCIWHDPDGDPFKAVPVIHEYQVPTGYWDELVRRLTGGAS